MLDLTNILFSLSAQGGEKVERKGAFRQLFSGIFTENFHDVQKNEFVRN